MWIKFTHYLSFPHNNFFLLCYNIYCKIRLWKTLFWGDGMNYEKIWNSFLDKIKPEISDLQYDTWFSETKLIEIKDDKAIILVPMTIHKKQIKENYNELVERIFNDVTGSNFKTEYVTQEEIDTNITINTDEMGLIKEENFETNLDPKFSFENFIVGESNKFARYNALAIAEKPGMLYNPFFIYSSSGLGKTHLMHSIGNYIVKNSSKKVLYTPCSKFLDDFVEMCRCNKYNNYDGVVEFKKKYQDIDVLLMDDIQYLENVPTSQNEFFNIFNELFNKRKQIVIASDRSPEDLKKLEARLRTRFTCGLTVDIYPPTFDLRMDIINTKLEANEMTVEFPKDVKEYIASNCTSDIRTLEGAITRVYAYATIMNGSNIDLPLAMEALKDYFKQSIIAKNDIDKVLALVSEEYNISVAEIKSKKRNSNIAIPRQVAMFICRTVLNEPLTQIGKEFGGKDHTTVMHSVNKIENEIKNNIELKNLIDKLINKLK